MLFPIQATEMQLLKWTDNTIYNNRVTDNDHSLFMFNNLTNKQYSHYLHMPGTVVNVLYTKGLYNCPPCAGNVR